MNALKVRQVIQTRITPPKAPKNIIARSGIVELLSSSAGKKLLLVTAPAGYGKTTIVNEYIIQSNKTTAWVHITPDIKGVFNLLIYITSSLNRINEQFGDVIFETISLIENDTEKINDMDAALGELSGLIINELFLKFNEDVLIVLDDLHELQNEKYVLEFLDMLVSDLPDNIQLVIISRDLPKLNLTHLKAKRQLSEITQKELVFSEDEITSLALKIYSKPLSDKELVYLQSSVGGWITGIHLVMQAMGDKSNSGDGYLSSLPVNLFDYFAEEIFSKLDKGIKDFLLKTSHLENFDPEICNFILKSNNSSELLDYLLEKNIFLESKQFINVNGTIIIVYDYVQLFRTFLNSKSKEILSDNIQKEIFYNSSLFYHSSSNFEKAIDYSLLSGKLEYAEKLIIENFDEFFLNGRFEKLWNWINSLDENNLVNLKNIIYYKGVLCKYFLGQLDKALEYLNRAIEISRKDNDEDFTITAVIMKLEIMLNHGKTSDALKTLMEIEKIKSSDINKAKIFYFLGNIYFQNNDLTKSLAYSNKALELCGNIGENTIAEDIYNLLGNINIIKGEFVYSIHYYELTLSMTRSLQKKLVVQGNLAILYSRSGKFRKAKEFYDETLKILRFFSSPVFEIVVKMTEYTLIFESGDYTSSIALAAEINKLALKLKNSQYIYLSYQFLGECSYYLGNSESAIKYLELSEKYMNSSSEFDNILNSLLKTISKIDKNPTEESEIELIKAYDYLTSIDSNYDRSIAGFYLAKCYQKNNPETCNQFIEKVFSLSKKKGYYSFLLREYIISDSIFRLAGNKYKETLKEFLASTAEIAELNWISDNYRDFLIKFVQSKYDLKMLAFGGLRFILKGEEIPEKKWIRKKRKLLLCYLLFSHNQTISKDKIVDIFFRDTPIDSTDNTFHQAVSNLRTALRVQTKEDQNKNVKVSSVNPEYIIYEDKTLRLNQSYSYYSDLEDFDNLINNANSNQNPEQCTEYLIKAITLYSGDVLEGYYEDWCNTIREEYRNKFIKISEKLLKLLSAQNRLDEMIEYAEKLNRMDNLNIASIKAMVRAYINLGKVNLARYKIDKFITQYEEEIGEKPQHSTLNDIERLFEK